MTSRATLTLLCLAWLAGAQADELPPGNYAIDDEQSWLHIRVYRAGLMAGLGHNHIVSTISIEGCVRYEQSIESSSLQLRFAVNSLVVDDPQLREAAGDGFPGEISDKDIRATRNNMLGRKLLDAKRFPDIRIASTAVVADNADLRVDAKITVKGVDYPVRIPATLTTGERTIEAIGELSLSHAQLGLKPFSAALGTLKVASDMLIQFRIVAVLAD